MCTWVNTIILGFITLHVQYKEKSKYFLPFFSPNLGARLAFPRDLIKKRKILVFAKQFFVTIQ